MVHYADDDEQRRQPRFPFPWLILSRRYVQRQFLDIRRHLMSLEQAIQQIGVKVSAVDDVLVQLNDATNLVAARLETVIGTMDAETAAKIQPYVDHLKALAADPNNPVPEPPVEEGA